VCLHCAYAPSNVPVHVTLVALVFMSLLYVNCNKRINEQNAWQNKRINKQTNDKQKVKSMNKCISFCISFSTLLGAHTNTSRMQSMQQIGSNGTNLLVYDFDWPTNLPVNAARCSGVSPTSLTKSTSAPFYNQQSQIQQNTTQSTRATEIKNQLIH